MSWSSSYYFDKYANWWHLNTTSLIDYISLTMNLSKRPKESNKDCAPSCLPFPTSLASPFLSLSPISLCLYLSLFLSPSLSPSLAPSSSALSLSPLTQRLPLSLSLSYTFSFFSLFLTRSLSRLWALIKPLKANSCFTRDRHNDWEGKWYFYDTCCIMHVTPGVMLYAWHMISFFISNVIVNNIGSHALLTSTQLVKTNTILIVTLKLKRNLFYF